MKKSVTTNEIDTNNVFFDTEKKQNQSDLGLRIIHQKPTINTKDVTTAMWLSD
jgi:hypothetical protein